MRLGQLAGLAGASVPVSPDRLCRDVDGMFRADPELRSVVVRSDSGRLVLVNRARFYQVMTGPKGFGWALYSAKPVREILHQVDIDVSMPATMPVVDAGLKLLDGQAVNAGDDVLVTEGDGTARSLSVASILAQVARAYASQVAEVSAKERRFRALVQGSSDVISVIDPDGRILYMSVAAERVMGHPVDRGLGSSAFDLMHPEDVAPCRSLLTHVAGTPGSEVPVSFRALRADGEVRWMEGSARNLLDDPAVGGVVVNFRDVTDHHHLQEQLRHQAFHDSLTGLPNRLLITDRADQMLARSRRSSHACAALLIDLDRFKDVNDVHGHGIGDRLLSLVAERLRLLLRSSDTVGRLGGDEFVALVEGDSLDAGPGVVAQRILDCLRTPFEIDTLSLNVTASIGISVGDHGDASELFRDADIALYRAKGAGRNGFAVFNDKMREEVERRAWITADLPVALDQGELFIDYQPAFSLGDGQMIGVEALLRWNHPARGRVAPADFVPSLEESGLIALVGAWVLREACRVAAELHAEGHKIAMSVNVSPRQLDQEEELYGHVVDALSSSGLPPAYLVLEITESTLMRDADATARHLRRLKEVGVRIAIDDFGTGYSSLSYLATFPVDALKVDRSFVANLGCSSEADALVQSVLELGRALSLQTVAEGIEEPRQLEILRRHGCNAGQGFELARPGTVEQLRDLLRWLAAPCPS